MFLKKCFGAILTKELALSRFTAGRRQQVHASPSLALKSLIPIQWVRPERVPCIHPSKSGDLKPLAEIDLNQFPLEYRELPELETADENVRRLFTLKFHPYKKTVEALRDEYLGKVRRHSLDRLSPEARVAKMTADIRDLQKAVESHPRNKRAKVRLKETIDKRKRLLKFMRNWDYKCFEWTLENMDLFYKPEPGPDVHKRVERKRSIRMLTEKRCEEIKNQKLNEYRARLEAEKESFLVDKLKTLEWIRQEELDCGVAETVSSEDIERTRKQLEDFRLKNKKEEAQET